MPALRLAGHKWRVSSDFVPIFACVSLVFHVIWCVFIIVWPFGITKVHKCNNTKPGRQFLASVWLFFILYVTSAVQEILIIIIGLRGTPKLDRDVAADCKPCRRTRCKASVSHSGTPLETRKRKAMIPVLYTQTANWIAQIGAVGMQFPVVSAKLPAAVPSSGANAGACLALKQAQDLASQSVQSGIEQSVRLYVLQLMAHM